MGTADSDEAEARTAEGARQVATTFTKGRQSEGNTRHEGKNAMWHFARNQRGQTLH